MAAPSPEPSITADSPAQAWGQVCSEHRPCVLEEVRATSLKSMSLMALKERADGKFRDRSGARMAPSRPEITAAMGPSASPAGRA